MAPLDENRASKRRKCNYTDTITVRVSPDKTSYTIHKELICAKSGFFRAATSGAWIEARDKTINLPEVEPQYFQAYFHWVYASQVDMTLISEPIPTKFGASYLTLAKLWMLGDMLLDNKFCNRLTNLTLEKFARISSEPDASVAPVAMGTLQYVWANTTPDSKLRKLHIDMWSCAVNPERASRSTKELPKDFAADIVKRYVMGEGKVQLLEHKGKLKESCQCRYHIHEEGKPCDE